MKHSVALSALIADCGHLLKRQLPCKFLLTIGGVPGLVTAIFKGYRQDKEPIQIAALKNHLSYCSNQIRKGSSLLIRECNHVIARLVPAQDPSDGADEPKKILIELENAGVLRLGKGRIPPALLKRKSRSEVNADVVGALLEEREEGR